MKDQDRRLKKLKKIKDYILNNLMCTLKECLFCLINSGSFVEPFTIRPVVDIKASFQEDFQIPICNLNSLGNSNLTIFKKKTKNQNCE